MMRKVSDALDTERIMEMSNLNTKQDKVVYLRDAGFTNDEIAFNLNTSVASVQSMLSRSKGQMSTQRFQASTLIDNAISGEEIAAPTPKKEFKLRTEKIGDMVFPDYLCFRTGTIIDKMLSDHDEEGGAFSGCVYVVPGESGSGKSTWLIDYLVKVMAFMNVEKQVARPVYVSGEMTRNDLYFYKAKMPGIAAVDTLLCNEYMRDGQLSDAIEAIFKSPDYNILVVDSYQDIVEKMRDAYNMKESQAENWLINLMVEAAEKNGKLIFAIQHMTKSGQYVGGTFLKHVTTGMIFIRKDKVNASERYIEVSKNRRGGSMTDRPLYFYLRKGAVEYDEMRFSSETAALNSSAVNSEARKEMFDTFLHNIDNPQPVDTNTPTNVTSDTSGLDTLSNRMARAEAVDNEEGELEPTEVVGHVTPVGEIADAVIVHE